MISLGTIYTIGVIICFANTPYAHYGFKWWPQVIPARFRPIPSRYRDVPHFYMPSLQSPINIKASLASAVVLPNLRFEHILSNNVLINVRNNGETVSFEVADNSALKPLLLGGPLTSHGAFEFNELHIHWGTQDKTGSEHMINGRRYAIEGHCVHFNRKYRTYDEARKYPDGLAVVAFFMKAQRKDNLKLLRVVRVLPNITYPGSVVQLTARDALSWFAELGQPKNYFTYPGSLTTTPFSENVFWIVYPNPVLVSSRQVNAFRSLLANDLTELTDNIRPIQPFNRRPLLYTV